VFDLRPKADKEDFDMKAAIAIVAALLILGLIAWFAVSAARGNNSSCGHGNTFSLSPSNLWPP
jgi:hypothetical protein